jgi:hypothetical protein
VVIVGMVVSSWPSVSARDDPPGRRAFESVDSLAAGCHTAQIASAWSHAAPVGDWAVEFTDANNFR